MQSKVWEKKEVDGDVWMSVGKNELPGRGMSAWLG
jgi:hypothetical protein